MWNMFSFFFHSRITRAETLTHPRGLFQIYHSDTVYTDLLEWAWSGHLEPTEFGPLGTRDSYFQPISIPESGVNELDRSGSREIT